MVIRPLTLGSESGGGGASIGVQQDWPTELHNPRIDADNIIVRSDYWGIVGLFLWATPPVVQLPIGATLLGLLCLEGMPLQVQETGDDDGLRRYRNKPAHQVPVRKVVEEFPFETYSRNAYDLERLMLRYLEEMVTGLALDPALWDHVFSSMMQGVEAMAGTTDGDEECYRHQVNRIEWDWVHFPDKRAFLKKDGQEVEADTGNDHIKMEI